MNITKNTKFFKAASMTCAVGVALALGGCLDREKEVSALSQAQSKLRAVEILNNSPDNAVRSWWAVKDKGMDLIKAQCEQYAIDQLAYTDKLSAMSEMSKPARNCHVETYDRDITKVDVESETRAVVYARVINTAPPDQGAVVESSDEARKKEGDKYRYTLGRKNSSSGWMITAIQNFPSWERDWTDVNPKSKPSANSYVHAPYQ